VRVINSRRLRCVGHIDRMEEGRLDFRIVTDKLKGKKALVRNIWSWEKY
jgi:hypothetical protein